MIEPRNLAHGGHRISSGSRTKVDVVYKTEGSSFGYAIVSRCYHEKMWIIDGETDHAVAVVGGLNIDSEYFRIDPQNPSRY